MSQENTVLTYLGTSLHPVVGGCWYCGKEKQLKENRLVIKTDGMICVESICAIGHLNYELIGHASEGTLEMIRKELQRQEFMKKTLSAGEIQKALKIYPLQKTRLPYECPECKDGTIMKYLGDDIYKCMYCGSLGRAVEVK